MATSVKVNVSVELVENDDRTFTVKVSTNSETYLNGQLANQTAPTVRREKTFNNEAEAQKYFTEERFKFEK